LIGRYRQAETSNTKQSEKLMSLQTTILIAAACLSLPAFGQPLVDASWLSQHIKDRDLVVLHVGDAPGYARGHIAGARQLTVADISKPTEAGRNTAPAGATELSFELPSVDVLRSKFEALGVSDRSRIVIYGDAQQPLPAVTRVTHVLNYLGLSERTSILNGGLGAWAKAGQSTAPEAPAVTPGKLSPKVNQSLFVDAEFVASLSQKSGYKLIDARAPANFKGIAPTFGKAGHIPGAVNIPFNEVNDDTQQFNRDHISELFAAAGVKPGDKLVVYCHIGLQGTEVIFGARLLGIDASLYDGSFQDWAINNRGPVEK
jgi:thiosulfate/3-mercaptopyruvate sulfurtransferase